MAHVLSARFSLELTTLFPFRQFLSPLLDRCPRGGTSCTSPTAHDDAYDVFVTLPHHTKESGITTAGTMNFPIPGIIRRSIAAFE